MTAPTIDTAAIPAATVQSHASFLLQLPDKTLLCAWFGGSQEGLPDICIWLSHKPPGSDQWSSPTKISSDEGRSCQNPVLFRDPIDGGKLWLFHTSQELGDQDSAVVVVRTSTDDGKTWSAPRFPLGEGVRGAFVRQPVVVLADGSWVLPVFRCRAKEGERWIGNDDISAVFCSRDRGDTWVETVVPNSFGCVHMNIVPPLPGSSGGEYVALFRSRWADNVYRSTSPDGISWAEPEPILSLPNPNSGIGAARLPSGKIALVFNKTSHEPGQATRQGLYDDITPEADKRPDQAAPHRGGKTAIWGTPRGALTLGISADGGRTWETQRLLEAGDGFCMTNDSREKTNRELSYPSFMVEEDGSGHVAFTFHRQFIKYVRISDVEGWVKGGQ